MWYQGTYFDYDTGPLVGLFQDSFFDRVDIATKSTIDDPVAACLIGTIYIEARRCNVSSEQLEQRMYAHTLNSDMTSLAQWNDEDGRTADQVAELFREVATKERARYGL